MLHGVGPVQGGSFWFSAAAPEADGIALDGAPEGPGNHTAYRSGWAAWCGNCHDPRYHQMGQSAFSHPVDRGLGAPVATRYDSYRGDADPTGGSSAASYLPQVPFEDPAQTVGSTSGPFGGSRLNCMTCHRAHASSAPAAGRWDFAVVTLEQDGQASGSLALPNPYPGPAQRSLCLKCHDVSHDAGAACLSCHRDDAPGGSGDPLIPIGN